MEISAPGAGGGNVQDIVVVGRNIPSRSAPRREVISVLSQADIARTGEGDIAGALQRVTGLSRGRAMASSTCAALATATPPRC